MGALLPLFLRGPALGLSPQQRVPTEALLRDPLESIPFNYFNKPCFDKCFNSISRDSGGEWGVGRANQASQASPSPGSTPSVQ